MNSKQKNLILVSRKPIVIQIFTLICKKLDINLEILKEAQIDHKVDIIVVDNEFIDDRFNIIKKYATLIGGIAKEELPFEIANDFRVPLPFLPSTLQEVLEEQLKVVDSKNRKKVYVSNIEEEQTQEEQPAVDYLQSLASDIALDMEEENDDSIVSVASIEKTAGVLDTKEINAIQEIMNPKEKKDELKEFATGCSTDDWQDLSSIIDQAINEVNIEDDIPHEEPTNCTQIALNEYELEELTPLLNKLDQSMIDDLTNGKTVNLQLILG